MNRPALQICTAVNVLFLSAALGLAADPPGKGKAPAGDSKLTQRIGIESPAQANARNSSRAKLDIPKGDVTPPPAATAVTVQSLQTMLENMGYEPKLGEYSNGAKYLTLSITRGGLTVGVSVDLSPDKTVVWFTTYLAEVKEPEKARPMALLKLIEAESTVWPSYFTYYSQPKTLYINRPLKVADVKPATMRASLDAFMTNVETTIGLWDPSKWSEEPAAAAGK